MRENGRQLEGKTFMIDRHLQGLIGGAESASSAARLQTCYRRCELPPLDEWSLNCPAERC